MVACTIIQSKSESHFNDIKSIFSLLVWSLHWYKVKIVLSISHSSNVKPVCALCLCIRVWLRKWKDVLNGRSNMDWFELNNFVCFWKLRNNVEHQTFGFVHSFKRSIFSSLPSFIWLTKLPRCKRQTLSHSHYFPSSFPSSTNAYFPFSFPNRTVFIMCKKGSLAFKSTSRSEKEYK